VVNLMCRRLCKVFSDTALFILTIGKRFVDSNSICVLKYLLTYFTEYPHFICHRSTCNAKDNNLQLRFSTFFTSTSAFSAET